MKLVVGYDRDLAFQFFLRTFQTIAPGGVFDETRTFLPDEFEYVAAQLVDTVVFSVDPEHIVGSPWWRGDLNELAQSTDQSDDESLLQNAETVANILLIREGIVVRKTSPLDWYYNLLASRLYRNASRRRLKESERFTLRRMSRNVEPWTELLSRIPGNDYLEMMFERTSPLALPGEA